MPPVAVLLDSRAALSALRRTLPADAGPVLACRTPAGLRLVLGTRLLDAVVLGPIAAVQKVDLEELDRGFPALPLVVYGVFRSDDSRLLLQLATVHRASAVLIEGVDDPVAGDLVARHTMSARRRTQLADAPLLLRLTEPLQLKTWDLLLGSPGRPPSTVALAARLRVSREYLSRQFAAGGAPNLKRVIDFLQVVTALELLANPGYSPVVVSRLLGYGTPGHLPVKVHRITGLALPEARALPARELLGRFIRGAARSRR